MKLKFYTLFKQGIICLAFLVCGSKSFSQSQQFYIDSVLWATNDSVYLSMKTKSFTNVVNFQGTIKWDASMLKLDTAGIRAMGAPANFIVNVNNTVFPSSNFSLGTLAAAQSNGTLTYTYVNAAGNHTTPDGTTVLTMKFKLINGLTSAYSDQLLKFDNSVTALGIDTAADLGGLSDFANLTFPTGANHINGLVSFARPPFLVANHPNVSDTITNRPLGCTYQWTVDGNPSTGTDISNFNNAPDGSKICLTITYPNGNSVSCSNANGGLLPVKWISLISKLSNNKVDLNWVTADELNNKGFHVERSFDGNKFEQIGFVTANKTFNYSFNDTYIGKATWYRLKQVDNNGKFSFSKTIKVSSSSSFETSIYPNPAKGSVRVEGNGIKKVVITDLMGKTISTTNFDAVNLATLNISNLARGAYFVNVITANNSSISKLLVD